VLHLPFVHEPFAQIAFCTAMHTQHMYRHCTHLDLLLCVALPPVLLPLLLLLPGKYVIVKSRMLDKSQTSSAQTNVETGTNICLMNKHYIVMPTAACTGVDDNKKECTGGRQGGCCTALQCIA
jgi:hypothetical protein